MVLAALFLLSVFFASSLGGDLLDLLRAQPALQGHKQRAQQERLTQARQQEPLMRQEQQEQQVPPALSMRSLAALVAPISAAWGNIDCVGQNWLHGSISLAAWVDTSKLWFLSVTSATVQLWTLTANSAIDTLWAAAASPASGCQNLGRAEAADSLCDHQTLGVLAASGGY
jgi:hypothetical protein